MSNEEDLCEALIRLLEKEHGIARTEVTYARRHWIAAKSVSQQKQRLFGIEFGPSLVVVSPTFEPFEHLCAA